MPGPAPNRKILIVDDERDLVVPLALRLAAGAGFQVLTAYDGEDGLRKAEAHQPEAAVVDIAMPEMDGWEVCRRLRENPRTRGTALIMMTAWLTKEMEKRALDAGVRKVLLKPFDDRDLLEALQSFR